MKKPVVSIRVGDICLVYDGTPEDVYFLKNWKTPLPWTLCSDLGMFAHAIATCESDDLVVLQRVVDGMFANNFGRDDALDMAKEVFSSVTGNVKRVSVDRDKNGRWEIRVFHEGFPARFGTVLALNDGDVPKFAHACGRYAAAWWIAWAVSHASGTLDERRGLADELCRLWNKTHDIIAVAKMAQEEGGISDLCADPTAVALGRECAPAMKEKLIGDAHDDAVPLSKESRDAPRDARWVLRSGYHSADAVKILSADEHWSNLKAIREKRRIPDESSTSDAGWRIAGSQLTRLARGPLVALLQRHLAPGDDGLRGRIVAFLSTPIGGALISTILSAGLDRIPQAPDRLAKEVRVLAMEKAGDGLVDLLLDPMREVVATYLQNAPETIEYLTEERQRVSEHV